MYRSLPILIFVLTAHASLAQLKIVVRDAETHKKLRNAQVQLLGENKPPMTLRFEKSCGCARLDSVPDGYDVAVARQEGVYSERGVFLSKAQSGKLEIGLYHTGFVYYGFDKAYLAYLGNGRKTYMRASAYVEQLLDEFQHKDSISRPTFKNLYYEDPYHIAILSLTLVEIPGDLQSKLDQLGLEAVCQGADYKQQCKCYSFYLHDRFTVDEPPCPAPITSGVFFIRRRDRGRFDRFHSPEISALRNAGFTVASVVYREMRYYGAKSFSFRTFFRGARSVTPFAREVRDTEYDFAYIKYSNDFYYSTWKKDFSAFQGRKGERDPSIGDIGTDDMCNYVVHFVMPKEKNNSSGLGILDDPEAATTDLPLLFNVLPRKVLLSLHFLSQ